MPMTPARRKANKKHDAKAYDKFLVRVYKGDKEKIQAFAATKGESLNGFVNRLIFEATGIKTIGAGEAEEKLKISLPSRNNAISFKKLRKGQEGNCTNG